MCYTVSCFQGLNLTLLLWNSGSDLVLDNMFCFMVIELHQEHCISWRKFLQVWAAACKVSDKSQEFPTSQFFYWKVSGKDIHYYISCSVTCRLINSKCKTNYRNDRKLSITCPVWVYAKPKTPEGNRKHLQLKPAGRDVYGSISWSLTMCFNFSVHCYCLPLA